MGHLSKNIEDKKGKLWKPKLTKMVQTALLKKHTQRGDSIIGMLYCICQLGKFFTSKLKITQSCWCPSKN